tara:strand:+ start:36453 stop:37508 length:1056 start_codon:yes stop_codon:yes gene_type:complete
LSLILATGGLGFIGSHTCISLLENQFDILIIDSLINSSIENLERIKLIKNNQSYLGQIYFVKGDLRDVNLLDDIFNNYFLKKNPIEAVIHFAGLKSVEESVMFPLKYWDTNINSLLCLLKVMNKYNCKKFVFSSSATIYEPLEKEKLKEGSIKLPINPYGNTKLTSEKILNDLYKSDKSWKIVNLRYFNPVGAHESSLLGENPKGMPSNLFPIISKVIVGELEKLSIFGNDWPTKDGTCIRDYIHVMDLAEAHCAALKFVKNNRSQMISLNIGNSLGFSVLEIVKTYSKVNNILINYEFNDRRKGDAPYIVADNSLALKTLNWIPFRSIEDICKDSFNFTQKQFKSIPNRN